MVLLIITPVICMNTFFIYLLSKTTYWADSLSVNTTMRWVK